VGLRDDRIKPISKNTFLDERLIFKTLRVDAKVFFFFILFL